MDESSVADVVLWIKVEPPAHQELRKSNELIQSATWTSFFGVTAPLSSLMKRFWPWKRLFMWLSKFTGLSMLLVYQCFWCSLHFGLLGQDRLYGAPKYHEIAVHKDGVCMDHMKNCCVMDWGLHPSHLTWEESAKCKGPITHVLAFWKLSAVDHFSEGV